MTFTADGKRQRLPLIFYSFLVILNKSHKNREVSLTIHSKYKYFYSTVQRAEHRRQKFHFCRLPSAVNVMLNLSSLYLLPIVNAKSRFNASGISSRHAVFVRRLGDLVSTRKTANREKCL